MWKKRLTSSVNVRYTIIVSHQAYESMWKTLDVLHFSINDRGMRPSEFIYAKEHIAKQREKLENAKPDDFPRELQKYLEMLITVKGHAWCMDVASERRKMAKLIAGALYGNHD